MSNKMTVADQKYIQSVAGQGLESVPMEVLPIPRVNLVQHSTTKAILADGKPAKAGDYFNTTSQESFENIECSVLRAGVSRVRFEEGVLGSPPLCKSRNGVSSTEGLSCADCAFSQWTEKPPACKLSLDFLCVDDKDRRPFWISAGGTSFAAARKALMLMIWSALPAYGHYLKLESKEILGKKGKFFVMVFRILGPRPVNEVRDLEKLHLQYGGAMAKGSEDEAVADIEPKDDHPPTGGESVPVGDVPF